MTALLKKLYVDWGFRPGLTPALRMKIIRWMYRDRSNISIGELCNFEDFNNIGTVEPRANMKLGFGLMVGGHTRLSCWGPGRLTIGDRCMIGAHGRITCRDRITIGDYFLGSWNMVIADYEAHPSGPEERIGQMNYMMAQFNPLFPWERTGLTPEQKHHFDTYWENPDNYLHAPITIGRNVWVGHDVTIMRGSTIGDNCIIGACSVVIGTIPDNCVVMGRPARPVKKDLDLEERKEYWKQAQGA